MIDLEQVVRAVVSNLHQSYLSREISEWYNIDVLQIMEELGFKTHSETTENPSDTFEKVRKHIFAKAFQREDIVDFLLNVPKWAGFQLDKTSLETREKVIATAKHSAISAIWIMALPRIIISHIISPHEFENQGVDIIVNRLLQSDASRNDFNETLFREFRDRGLDIGHFSMNGVTQGYTINESNREKRMRAVLALIMMKSTDCPFDLDSVFNLDKEPIIQETTAYIIAMHTKKVLSERITGSRSSRPFEWPLVGTVRVFSGLIETLEVLMKFASRISTCSLFTITSKGKRMSWTEEEFISFLIREITECYSSALRLQSGKKNEELARFVDILNGENIDITSRVMKSNDRAGILYEEFLECKRRARVGEKPQISPERRFRVILSTLKQRLEEAKNERVSSDDIINQIAGAFEAIIEIIQKHKDLLSNEIDKFTEELCFETSFKILEYLDFGSTITNLPWVSRFIAEESALRDISDGNIKKFQDEQRLRRIVSAYAGGVVYLVLQAWN